MKTAFRIFNLYHIPIEINYTWFIVFALVLISLARGYFPLTSPELSTITHWLLGMVATLLLFICLLLHELSHSYVAIKNGLPIHGITLFIFGGVAQMEGEPSSPAVEFKMALAGPVASLALGLLFFFLNCLFSLLGAGSALLATTSYLYLLNFFIAAFNLIPGFPLDGGRLLRAGLWYFSGNFKRATHIATSFGKAFAFILMGLGLLNFLTGAFITGLWLIFIGLFLQEAAEVSYRQVLVKKALSGVRVGDVMTKNIITVPEDLPLNQLVDDYFFRFRFSSFPVFSKDDRLLGIITLHNIKEVPKEKWAQSKVLDHMILLRDDLLAHENMSVIAALTKMAKNGLGRLLVIQDHKLIGIISHRDVNRLFEFKTDLEK